MNKNYNWKNKGRCRFKIKPYRFKESYIVRKKVEAFYSFSIKEF
ncbi:hypothetical protein QRA03_10280 [Bacillus paranthracis]